MWKTFKISRSIKNTYTTNAIIHSIKSIPVIGKLLPSELYSIGVLKTFAGVLAAIWDIFKIFFGKFLGTLIVFLVPFIIFIISEERSELMGSAFMHIFLLWTLIGAYINPVMFNEDINDYYAVIQLNIDAKKYIFSNYLYDMFRIVVGYIPFTILFGTGLCKLPLGVTFTMPFLVMLAKTVMCWVYIKLYDITGKFPTSSIPAWITAPLTVALFAIAYILPFTGINLISENEYYIIFVIAAVMGAIALTMLIRYKNFRAFYRQFLNNSQSVVEKAKTNATNITVDASRKYIGHNLGIASNKNGFEYLNDLFVKRHFRLLMKPVLIISVSAAAIFAGMVVLSVFDSELRASINQAVFGIMSISLFIMYIISRGQAFTQALFINCDHCLLTFPFYKEPKSILKLFSIRLKSLVKINIIPALVIAVGMLAVIAVTGGTEYPMYYVLIPFTIIMMSIFFSVHYMTLYYLLQPYTASTQIKNAAYSFINIVTYMVCYMFMQLQLNPLPMSIVVSIFCVIYCIAACVLVYKYAAKTFKIRA